MLLLLTGGGGVCIARTCWRRGRRKCRPFEEIGDLMRTGHDGDVLEGELFIGVRVSSLSFSFISFEEEQHADETAFLG